MKDTPSDDIGNIPIRAIIALVDGATDSVLRALRHYRPEYVAFISSQENFGEAGKILNDAKSQGIAFMSDLTLIDNPQDPYECIEKVREAIDRTRKKKYQAEEIIVDYLGGTKQMSVALAMVASNFGLSFSFVGPSAEDGGTPEAAPGHVRQWHFHVQVENRKILALFNRHQFKAAKEIADRLMRQDARTKPFYRRFGLVIEGFYRWDLFRHTEALDVFTKARIDELRDERARIIRLFAQDALYAISFLRELIASPKLSVYHILDLFANAERRFDEGKIDDAVLRLYRTVELCAQERLLNRYGITPSEVTPAQIPADVRDAFAEKYRDAYDGKIKIPLSGCYRLLSALGDDLGKTFVANEGRFRDLQSSRNLSYLAHGFSSSKEATYKSLREFLLNLGMISLDAVPVFPKIRL